jgi:rhodanese-related sulfurtransferase
MATGSPPDSEPAVAESLEPERVAELVRGGEAELIDVRQPEEWERGRVPGAVHIVLEEVTARAAEVPRDRTVVFACRGGNRSAMVADAFRHDGYDAYNMAGGLRAWEQAGLPLEGADGSVE